MNTELMNLIAEIDDLKKRLKEKRETNAPALERIREAKKKLRELIIFCDQNSLSANGHALNGRITFHVKRFSADICADSRVLIQIGDEYKPPVEPSSLSDICDENGNLIRGYKLFVDNYAAVFAAIEEALKMSAEKQIADLKEMLEA